MNTGCCLSDIIIIISLSSVSLVKVTASRCKMQITAFQFKNSVLMGTNRAEGFQAVASSSAHPTPNTQSLPGVLRSGCNLLPVW